jgi:hypothetical protein
MFLTKYRRNSAKHKNNKITQKQGLKQNYKNKYNNSNVMDLNKEKEPNLNLVEY